ncbi:MAG: TolC family protein [Deltaproteobacteria bacterium]|nr:TolC family protein [Deltaproteobacteria bacterium]
MLTLWISTLFFLLEILCLKTPAAAAEIRLDLDQAIQLALKRNLELQAKRQELGIAEGRLIRANLFLQFNPELEGDISNRRLFRPEPGFDKNLPQGGVSLSQELEIAGQSGYRREAAHRNLEKVRLEISDFERTLRFRTAEIFLKLLNAREKIRQAEHIVDLRSRLHEASKTRLALGDIPEVQLIVAEFGLNRSRSDLITLMREYEELLSRLKSELAIESDEKIELAGAFPRQAFAVSLNELLTAMDRRADLAAFDQERKVAEAEELLTRAKRIPNIKVGVFYDRDEKDNIVGGKISWPLPFFDRRQAEIHQALARKSIANIHYLNLRQSAVKALRAAYDKFKLSESELALYPEEAVKRFDENLELYQRAYQERAIDLADAILFQNQVVEARLKYIDALTNYNLSLAELKFQAGIE